LIQFAGWGGNTVQIIHEDVRVETAFMVYAIPAQPDFHISCVDFFLFSTAKALPPLPDCSPRMCFHRTAMISARAASLRAMYKRFPVVHRQSTIVLMASS